MLQNDYGPQITPIMARLSDPAELADFIAHEMEAHAITEWTVVSLAIDAMAMTAQRTYLPSGGQEIAFVIVLQPLDARLKCVPLHVMTLLSGVSQDPFVNLWTTFPGR
jgi:hypothetical protein